MRILKLLSLLFISFSLSFGGFANAAMLCGVVKSELATEMKAYSNKAEMPCHKTTEKSDKKIHHDKSCVNCKNCVSMSGIIYNQPIQKFTFANITHNSLIRVFYAELPADIYSPPKQIS